MSTTDNKLSIRIEGIQPILFVKDMAASRTFYTHVLDFKEEAWGDDNFTCVRRDNCAIYLCRGAQGCAGTWLWIGFYGDMTEPYNILQERGVTIRQPPANYPWALELHIEDPDGHVLRLGTDPLQEGTAHP